ncbi:MAG TPA: hypothetical protein VJ998_09650, partial [Pseudomonadales bacterium]|nr:hypothetical protein [Pseudomonadales bacterium]
MCLALGGCVSGLPKALVQQGRGDFQGLVADVESQYGSSEKAPPLERALSCYAYYELRQYHKFQVCAKFILAMDDPSFEFYPGMPKTYENASEVKATVHGYLAQMYFEFLQFDKAIAEADKSLELVEQAIEPGRKRYLRITALEAKALSLINLGRGNEVGPLITTIEAQQSNIPADKTQLAKFRQSALAKIYFAQGDYVDARKVLEERVSDVFGNILKQSARVFTDLEDGADTLAISNALPKLYMLDKAMLETGEIDQARAGYDKLLSQPVTKQFGDFYW